MDKPELYQNNNTMQKSDAKAFLEKYASKIKYKKNNNKVIDIGCGDGSVTNTLITYLPADFKLLGCDINKDMVNFAKDQNRNAQTSFAVLDIAGELPPKMKRSFDQVFSFYTLHWIQNQKQTFKNIFDLLDDDGESYIIFPARNSCQIFFRIMSQNSKWNPWMQNIDDYISPSNDSKEPAKDIAKLMESIGFIDINVECEDKVFLYDMLVFKNHFLAINPFKIPDDMLDDYYESFIEMLKETEIMHGIKNSTNSINFFYKLLKIYGHKASNKC